MPNNFFSAECHRILNGGKKYRAKKLCATFNKRERYVLHYVNLKKYLELGLKLTKVHRVLSFTQSFFLKKYVKHVTKLRKNAGSEFEKSLFKLMINANFGKFIEQKRKYLNVKLCKDESACKKLIASPHFTSFKVISEDLVAVFLKQHTVTLDRAYPIGFTILERSKEFMYTQFYQVIRPKLEGRDVQVLFSDTDSFALKITSLANKKSGDVLAELSDIFDFSNYKPSSHNFSKQNAGKLGFWKDELCGSVFSAMAAIRAKSYAILWRDDDDNLQIRSKCKGVTRGYKKTLNFQDFKKCLETVTSTTVSQFHIRSTNHVVKTLKVHKTCFSSFDDKRYLMSCGIHSIPYGSKFVEVTERTKKCIFCS